MPNVHRKKNCPACNVEFRGRGKCCSRACANSIRPISDKIRENMSRVATEYNLTPEGLASKKLNAEGIFSEDFAIQIPTIPDLSDYSDYLDGYDRGENW